MHRNKFTWAALATSLNLFAALLLSSKISYILLIIGLVSLGSLLIGDERDDFTTKFVIGPLLGITSMIGMYRHAPNSPWEFGIAVGCVAVFAVLGVVGMFMARSKSSKSRVAAGWTIASTFGIVVPTLWFGVYAMGGAGLIWAFVPLTLLGTFVFVTAVAAQGPDQEEGEYV